MNKEKKKELLPEKEKEPVMTASAVDSADQSGGGTEPGRQGKFGYFSGGEGLGRTGGNR